MGESVGTTLFYVFLLFLVYFFKIIFQTGEPEVVLGSPDEEDDGDVEEDGADDSKEGSSSGTDEEDDE